MCIACRCLFGESGSSLKSFRLDAGSERVGRSGMAVLSLLEDPAIESSAFGLGWSLAELCSCADGSKRRPCRVPSRAVHGAR